MNVFGKTKKSKRDINVKIKRINLYRASTVG